jgi:DNA polymerase-1
MSKSTKPVCALTGKKCGFVGYPIVHGEGPQQARLVLVGEAPGKTELQLKRPFVGAAGQTLNDALQEAGINRASCYITNACLCCSLPTRTPTATEWKACRERLLSEVREHNPALVVALGAVAIKALLPGEKRVKEVRGDVIHSEELGTYVLPTLHPAATLREPRLYHTMVRDLKKAAGIVRGDVQVTVPEVSYIVVQKPEDLNPLMSAHKLSVDTEGDITCIGMSGDGKTVYIVPEEALYHPDIREATKRVLHTADTIIAHNWKYDQRILSSFGMVEARKKFADTMLMSYVIDERAGTHGLKFLSREYLGVPDYSKEVRKYLTTGHVDECPKDLLYHYNALDVVNTYHLHTKLAGLLDDRQRNILDTILYPASDALALMEETGVMVDINMLDTMEVQLTELLDDIIWQMHTLADKEFNPNSWQQIAQVLYDELCLPVPFWMSTDSKALRTLVDATGHPVPNLLLCYRDKKKTLSTYVKALRKACDIQNRVHTHFNLTGTVTGRLSSSDPVNLQNISRGNLRNIFIAKPGYTLIEGDLSQAEVRAICWLARDEKLRDVLLSGVDVHIRTASLMHNKKPEEVTKAERTAAKTTTFGLLYGMGAKTLAKNLKISVAEAQRLVDLYFSIYPGVRKWVVEVENLVLSGQPYYTPFGRTRHFDPITAENRDEMLRQSVNTPVQSTASDITLSALIRIDKRIRKGDFGKSRLILTVHDSIMLEVPEDAAEEIARAVKDEMEQPVLGDWLPFPADVKIGKRWGSMKELEV